MTELNRLFNRANAEKLTENGDTSYNTTGDNPLLDLFFMSEYYSKHLDEAVDKLKCAKDVKSGSGYLPEYFYNDKTRLFTMFMRDARYGLGRRDLGRVLMHEADCAPEDIVTAGRFDDLLYPATDRGLLYLIEECENGNALAKKWAPRLDCQKPEKIALAKKICKLAGLKEKQYRALIKCETTESLLSSKRVDEINFSFVPSLALLKYWKRFQKEERFQEWLEAVKKGEKNINTRIVNIYDLYKNLGNLEAEADMYWEKIPKIKINCIPIIDTSGSMQDCNDSMGKAMSIGYYLSKCSSFCNGQVISFSSKPQLIDLSKERQSDSSNYLWYLNYNPLKNAKSQIAREMAKIYTGDCSNTDFGAVMKLLSGLKEYPDYLVVLSDMEFDAGSSLDKHLVMKMFQQTGVKTKIIWWNFNSRNTTAPEMDEYGNIFMSGYSPMLLQYLECGFNGNQFLDKLIQEYSKNLMNDLVAKKKGN